MDMDMVVLWDSRSILSGFIVIFGFREVAGTHIVAGFVLLLRREGWDCE